MERECGKKEYGGGKMIKKGMADQIYGRSCKGENQKSGKDKEWTVSDLISLQG